jgi:CheY-like chemotaxis protein
MADPAQVRQIAMNLVMNASEAIGDGEGVITVRAVALDPGEDVAGDLAIGELADSRHVLLEVTDTGEGMDAATLPQIFDPFFTTKFAGRGLGLAAVLGIMRRHGGALRVRSRKGSGSSFSVLLPVQEGDGLAEAVPGAGPRDAWSGAGTLLVVDDEEAVRSIASRMLRATGFEVLLAANGREALALLEAERDRIRAVLLDLTMPRMDGEETLRSIRKVSPDLPVVLCSGYDVVMKQERFAGLGVSGFLHKPFRLAELQRALRSALGD